MPSSHRFSDPAEENNILNHVISEDLQKYGFMYSRFSPFLRLVLNSLVEYRELYRCILYLRMTWYESSMSQKIPCYLKYFSYL